MMKKKIIAFFVVALQLFSLSAFAKNDFTVPEWMLDDVVATTNGMGEEYTDSYSLLSFLGAVDEPAGRIDPDSYAERGFTAEIFAKLYLGSTLPKATKETYRDVPFEHEWADGIYAAVDNGLIINTDSRFYPDKTITVNEVAKMGLVLLGYGGIENINVTKMTNDLKFLKGVTLTGDTLTKGQLFTMIRNILRADVLEYKITQKGDKVEYQGVRTGKSFLSEYKNIYLIEGVVTSMGESAIYGKQDGFDERIEINKIKYDTYQRIESDVLGQNIYAYVYDPDDQALIIDIWDTGDNTSYTVPGAIFEDLTNSYVSYTENDKTKKLKLNAETVVVYNGQYYGSLEKAVLNNIVADCDFVKALDNDDDSVYDVVFIEKTSYYIVDKVAPLAEQISFKYSSDILNIKNEENVILRNQSGDDIDIGSVSTGNILELKMAYRVNGDKCYNILISSNKISAELSESYVNKGVTYYKIDDEAYTFSKYYEDYLSTHSKERPQVGDNVTFYVGSNNKIVMTASNPYTFGYLLKKKIKTGLDSEVWVRLYSENGKFEELKLKDTVNLITYSNQIGSKKTAADALSEFCDASGNLESQLVCYSKNSKGEITTLVKEYDMTGQKPYDTGYPLVKNYSVGGEGYKTTGNRMYYRAFGMYNSSNGMWFIPTNVTNMSVAKDSANFDNEAYFGIGKLAGTTVEKYFTDEKAVFYNTDEYGRAGFLLMLGGSNATTDSRIFMVAEVKQGLNKKGESGTVVEFYNTNNQKESMFVGESEVLASSTNYPGVTSSDTAKNLAVGDLFRYKTNLDGEADYIEIIQKAGKNNKNWTYTSYSDNPGGSGLRNGFTFASNAVWSAQVVDTVANNGGMIKVNIDPTGNYDTNYDYTLQMNQFYNLYGNNIINLYNSAENKVEVASFGDIIPGDRVILIYHWTCVRGIFIIR